MKITSIRFLLIYSVFLQLSVNAQTIGVMVHTSESTDNGYVLFPPSGYTDTYLIDKCGRLIKSWHSNYQAGHSAYLLNDGSLLRAGNNNNPYFISGGRGGVIEKFDWDGNLIWNYVISDSLQCQHHDIYPMPNGNILVVIWEYKSRNEAIDAGRDPAKLDTSLWSEKIIEIQPINTDSAIIVWEWHLWDHLVQDYDSTKPNFNVIANHPELMNLNYTTGVATSRDWIHMNSVAYNPELDQIVMSGHNINEFWVVDHSTTTLEAGGHSGGSSGKGGDFLYRWGNPAAYNNGITTDRKFYGQHSVHWIDQGFPYAGSFLVFNNGLGRPEGNYSSIEIVTPPVDSNGTYNSSLPYLPASQAWIYTNVVPTYFYSSHISGAQMLANGHVVACNGNNGRLIEINENKSIVWRYIVPVNSNGPMTQGVSPIGNTTFRCTFYPDTFSGFDGHTLTPGLPIELNTTYTCELFTSVMDNIEISDCKITPNPANEFINIQCNELISEISLYSSDGKIIRTVKNQNIIQVNDLNAGFYHVKVKTKNDLTTFQKVIINK